MLLGYSLAYLLPFKNGYFNLHQHAALWMGVVEEMLWSTVSFIRNGTSNLQKINGATAGRSDSEISPRHQRSEISAE